jgi:hypothetical protein
MQTKYTNDGKKVAIVGKLNADQTIVQEIFITENGQEIPSGENFVVTSLHDAPVISWKEKKLKEIESKYESDIKKYEQAIDRLNKEYKDQSELLKAKMNYIGLALKNASPESFQTLVDYLTGEIKWIILDEKWGKPKLISIDKFNQKYEDRLRLLSFFGKDDGSFSYAIGAYSDYSGNKTTFIPYKEYEVAKARFEAILLQRGVNEDTLDAAKKHGIEFPKEMIEEYNHRILVSKQARIQEYKDKIAEVEKEIQERFQ